MKLTYSCLAGLTALAGILALATLDRTTAQAATGARGEIITVEPLEARDRTALQAIAAKFPGAIQVRQGARLHRLTYWTELKGQPVIASGLVSLPIGTNKLKGIVLYAHGTTTTRSLSPSQADRADGNEETAVFAGNGYLVVLPDYIGLGTSTLPQAFAIVRPQVDASIDMLRAVRQWMKRDSASWNPSLMLMGFSQGGQTVAGLHRELERMPLDGYRLRGTVSVAGPHDLRALSVRKSNVPEALELVNVGYLALAASAYAHYHDVPLDTVMTPENARAVPELFDGSKPLEFIAQHLPTDARLLFRPEFLYELQTNKDNWFTRALEENETFAWTPHIPLRIVFGDTDINVQAIASRALYDYAAPRGGAVSLHPTGPTDHMATVALSYAPTLEWFDTLAMTGK